MTKEWKNPYNPFNSVKCLIYADKLQKCALGECPEPVTVAIDPTNKCNYSCIWCNAYDIRQQNKCELSMQDLISIADFLKEWGVKGTCVAGGGEPYMNENTDDFLIKCYENEISNSVITNGSMLTDKNIEIMAKTCRWVGFSMDAGNSNTYMKVKGIKNDKMFLKVTENITKLRKVIDSNNSKCTIGYKFLLHPYNQEEIYGAAMEAKEIGAHDFQVRPVGWENMTLAKGELKWNYDFINAQLERMFELESKDFHLYGISHKYEDDLTRKVAFSKCRAASLHPVFCATGKLSLCVDMRGNPDLELCDYLPDPKIVKKYWNNVRHRQMLQSIDVNKCTKCTFAGYNEIVEKVFIDDSMCRNHV